MENRLQILSSCMETPKNIVGNYCFLCRFLSIPQARIRAFGKSSVDITYLIECAVEIDTSVLWSSNLFVCNRCYKRLLPFEKVKTNLRSLQCKMGLTSLHDFYGLSHLYICRSLFGHLTFFVTLFVFLKGT